MLAAPRARTPKSVRALVLAPTRELAAQIEENIRAYAANTSLTTALVFGGVNIRPQTEALADGVDFLVATPGRLLDHIGQHNVELAGVEFLVLDEADRMLDMGFIHDIRKILRLVPPTRQTLLFSATFSDDIRALADTLLVNPVSVEIARNKESTLITQEAWTIDKKRKRELLRDLIVDNAWEQVLVFTRMKHTANRIADQLGKDGIVAAAIHGNNAILAELMAMRLAVCLAGKDGGPVPRRCHDQVAQQFALAFFVNRPAFWVMSVLSLLRAISTDTRIARAVCVLRRNAI